MTAEMQSRVAPLVAVLVAERTNICRDPIAMDVDDEMVHGGFVEKIFEVFKHLAMTSITLIRPNCIEQYVFDEVAKMDKFYDVFRNLDKETQLIMTSATMPNKVLGVQDGSYQHN